ncbi:MAG: hypothetical protein K6U12_10340 [Armatimonadetes bacterium]|nr:hypothetical protein [Armatimonadota bacterium]
MADSVRPPGRVYGVEPIGRPPARDGERGKNAKRPPQPPTKDSPETPPPDTEHKVDVEV